MDTVSLILERNGGKVHSIEPEASVLEAAQRMNEAKIGSLVVLEGRSMKGIVTERDIMTRVVAQKRDPPTTRVADVMTSEVITCPPDTPIHAARDIMRERRIRRLPVRAGDELIGVITIGDLNAIETQRLSELVDSLETYIHKT